MTFKTKSWEIYLLTNLKYVEDSYANFCNSIDLLQKKFLRFIIYTSLKSETLNLFLGAFCPFKIT